MIELKPCLFCGREAYMKTHRFYGFPNTYNVICSHCGAPKPVAAQIARIAPGEIRFCYHCGSEIKNKSEAPHRCGECIYFSDCKDYVDGCETFREAEGCSFFEPEKKEEKK